MDRTDSKSDTPATRGRSRPVRDAHKDRAERQAWALQVVKGMGKSPSASETEPPQPAATFQPDPGAPGWVYFAYCAGRIKIGYTTNVANRMAQFVTHAPQPTTLLLAIGGDEEDEADYHANFAADRAHGEWFRLSFDLRDFLDRHTNDDGFPLLFEVEKAYHDASQADLAYITSLLNDIKEDSNELAPV